MAHSPQNPPESKEPPQWKTHKEWETNRIDSSALHNLPIAWALAITMLLISLPILFILHQALANDNLVILLALVLPIAGFFLVYRAVALTLEYRRFGQVYFEMDPYPGAIGGHIGGQIHIPKLSHQIATGASQIFVRLECVYSAMSSGQNRSRTERIKWAEQGTPKIESARQGVSLLFRFNVPEDLPQAEVSQIKDYYFWRVTVNAAFSGVDLYRQFNIPAFKSNTLSRAVHHDISAQFAAKREQASNAAKMAITMGDFDVPGLSESMHLNSQNDEIRMTFSIFRNKVMAIYAAIFAGSFGFASYSLINMIGTGNTFDIFIALFSLPFLIVAIIGTALAIYLPFNSLHVNIDAEKITASRRLFYTPIFFQTLKRANLSHISLKKHGSTGQGVDKIEHYKLIAHEKSGKKFTIAENINGKDVAQHFCGYLAQLLLVES